MISVLVRVEHGVDALVVTLSALVPAVADGLLCDAVILVKAADPAVERVADALGASVVVDWREPGRKARARQSATGSFALPTAKCRATAGSGPSTASLP